MKRRYGLLGLLSAIGVLGAATGQASLCPFLAFALFFGCFFVTPDVLFVERMRKAASWAFYADLALTTAVTCVCIAAGYQPDAALLRGVGAGFGTSLLVFSSACAWFEWRELRGSRP